MKLTGKHINGPIIGLAATAVFNRNLDALIGQSPDIATGISPDQMALIDKKGFDLPCFYRDSSLG
jgi:hypothetical protein